MDRFDFLSPDQVQVVPNGAVFTDSNKALREKTRARWGAEPGEVVIGSVGRLVAQKGPIFALEIVAILKRKGLPVQYVWIGDGGMRSAFQEGARRRGIADCVRLEGWRDDVSSCLQGLDIFIMPSKFEGMPLALLEAMGMGLCCCASDIDGIVETIEDGLNGYLCALGDLESWCRRLETLIADPELRVAVGSRARDISRRRFGVETMASETANVYEDVVNAPSKQ
jgi:glycosyltransferase involved in cell wall biosynthesis